MKKYAFYLILILSVFGCGDLADDGGPNCTTGKRCGDSCIARNKTCRK